MQYTTMTLGALIVIYSLYITLTSLRSPNKLVKLKYMQAKLGKNSGGIVHTLVYIVVPLIFGIFLIKMGVDGVTLKALFIRG